MHYDCRWMVYEPDEEFARKTRGREEQLLGGETLHPTFVPQLVYVVFTVRNWVSGGVKQLIRKKLKHNSINIITALASANGTFPPPPAEGGRVQY